jgi:hypothetical protein
MAQNGSSGGAAALPPLPRNSAGWLLGTAPARALADYYLAARGDAPVLSRATFDPAALKTILPRVFMLELRSERELRIRLCGTCLTTRVGRELAGLNWLDLIAPEGRANRAEAYSRMMREASGLRAEIRYPSSLGEVLSIECLTLPLTPHTASEPPLAVGVIASLERRVGARPLPFLQGTEKTTELPLAA